VVSSASFIKLFEKARTKWQNPNRKRCKHGHAISAANAHVGDLKRTGTYSCDPCNRTSQLRYMSKAAKAATK
jgi:hypothetical protein